MIDKATLVLGPPGTGKTHYLVERIKEAIGEGVHPSRIGVISFTRKAIQEMMARACGEFNLDPRHFPYIRTSHSLGYHGLGLQKEDVMTKEDWNNIGRELNLFFEDDDKDTFEDGKGIPTLGGSGCAYLQINHKARYRMVDLQTQYNEERNYNLFYAKLEQFSNQLVEYKGATNKFDFVDMIEKFNEIGEAPNLDYLFVDEAQDFTPLQWEMAEKVAEKSKKVYIAGDDDQAIHRWTGVEVDIFKNSSKNIHVLNQSYRIPRAVHALARVIVTKIEDRHTKVFAAKEEKGLVEYINYLEDAPLHEGSWTIMARTNGYAKDLAKAVRKMGYKYSIKDRPSVSLKLVENLYTWADLCQDKPVVLQRIVNLYKSVPKRGDKKVVKHGSTQQLEALPPETELTMSELQIKFGLLKGAEHDGYDVLNVSEFEQDYIAALQRRGDDLLSDPRIKISTIHAMKGGEDDNCIVYLRSTKKAVQSRYQDDEHRAFYVAVTRAKHTLYLLQTNHTWRYMI